MISFKRLIAVNIDKFRAVFFTQPKADLDSLCGVGDGKATKTAVGKKQVIT